MRQYICEIHQSATELLTCEICRHATTVLYRIAAQCENIYSGCFEDGYDAVICVAGKFENIKLYVHTLCISANVTKVSKHSSITQYNLSPFSLVLLIRCQYSFKLVLPSLFLHPTSSFFKLIFCIAHTFF